MAIIWWLFTVNIVIFQPVVSLDVIQILDSWIFGSTIHRKILFDTDAQKKFISEQDDIRKSIHTLERDIEKIGWDIEKWKEYHRNCNIIMYFIVSWILSTLERREAKKHESLKELRWRQNSEPFCDQYQPSGAYHIHWDSICAKAFEDKFFRNKKWTLITRDDVSCQYIDIYKIETSQQTAQHHKLINNRFARRCLAQHEESHLRFDIYLLSSMNYKPDGNILSYYVVVENILREGSRSDSGIFGNLFSNNNGRKEIIAYIEK